MKAMLSHEAFLPSHILFYAAEVCGPFIATLSHYLEARHMLNVISSYPFPSVLVCSILKHLRIEFDCFICFADIEIHLDSHGEPLPHNFQGAHLQEPSRDLKWKGKTVPKKDQ
jgi:hypothetical protein